MAERDSRCLARIIGFVRAMQPMHRPVPYDAPMAHRNEPVVMIVGGGFGGIAAAQALAKAPVRVVVVDRQNHHLFQPLLYQVATSVLASPNIAFPIRRIFRDQANVHVFNAEVAGIDCAARTLTLTDGNVAPFDYLVLAAGAGSSYFGHEEWARFAPGMKTLEDATLIRDRILRAFEDAEGETDPDAMRAHLTFIVVGGGPTGVELSGAIKELGVDSIARDYRRFDAASARVILVEAGDRLLASFGPESSKAAHAALERIGVEVRVGARVTDVFDGGVEVSGERIMADTVVWSAGVRANPLGQALGAELDRSGRVVVEPDCSVKGCPDVFVIGDMASIRCATTGKAVPGVAPAAMQMGAFVAGIIAREASARAGGTATPPRGAFRYHDKGSMATIGRAKAVAEIGRMRFSGLPAWLAWLLVHLVLLVGFHNRVLVFLSWAFAYLSFSKGARIITGDTPSRIVRPLGNRDGSDPAERARTMQLLKARM